MSLSIVRRKVKSLAAKKESFETRLETLDALVQKMEAGGMSLSDTIKSYEEGIKLADSLKKELSAAEAKLTILRADGSTEEA